jgi:hypothetical protein
VKALRIACFLAGGVLVAWGLFVLAEAAINHLEIANLGGIVLIAVPLLLGSGLITTAVMAPRLGRPCPQCGKGVKRGLLICPTCGFDFKTQASFGSAQLAPIQGPQPPGQS